MIKHKEVKKTKQGVKPIETVKQVLIEVKPAEIVIKQEVKLSAEIVKHEEKQKEKLLLCQRCGAEMRVDKVNANETRWLCPKCGASIGSIDRGNK